MIFNKGNPMKSKILFSLSVVASAVAFASNSNAAFQEFENQYNIGYGISQGELKSGTNVDNTSLYNTQSINLEVERLFDVGVWLDGNMGFLTSYNQGSLNSLNSGFGLGQYPFFNNVDLRAGYAFNLVDNHLQVIPYVMVGRSANWAVSTILANGQENLAQDFFYNGGLGARLNYRINSAIMVYADGLYTYNWDNSAAIKDIQVPTFGKSYAATNYEFTSTLGAKFNVYRNLQLGANAFWNNFQSQSNISGLIYTPTNSYGAEATIGLTY